MTGDEFEETYEAMLDAAHDGYAVCVMPLEGASEKLGVVLMPASPEALESAEFLDDDELLHLSTVLMIRARKIADRMASEGIDSFDGTSQD